MEVGKEGNRWNGEAMEAVDRARLLPTYASFRYTSLRLRRRRDGTWVVRSGPDRRRKETVRSGGDVPTTRLTPLFLPLSRSLRSLLSTFASCHSYPRSTREVRT